MKLMLSGMMVVGLIGAAGCEDHHPADNRAGSGMGDNNGTTAGGNGSFGTDPVRPGSHDNNGGGATPDSNGSSSGQHGSGM